MLNPSDREAEIGHKGVGYQVQITESCSAGNDVQLITSAIPQGGSQSDMASFPIVMNKLEEENALPEKIYSDAGYGSDLEKCEFEDDGRMLKCPAGKRPMYREFKNGHGRAVFHLNACNDCPLRTQCRSRKKGKWNREFRYNQKDLRIRMRLQQESTAEFRSEYRKRIPIESLNGRLKQYTQLQRLRVRGRNAVYHTISAILAMHNIMQAARYAKIQTQKGIVGLFFHFL